MILSVITSPLSSLWDLRAAAWASPHHRTTVWRLLLQRRRKLVCFELGREILRGRVYGFCGDGDNWTRSYWGNVRGLQEVGAHRGGSRGGQASACSGHPGLWRQWRWSHSHPPLQVQRTGTEVQTTCIHIHFILPLHWDIVILLSHFCHTFNVNID